MRGRARRGLPWVLALLGAGLVAHGAWIPAKAALAQRLLERAWLSTRGGEDAVRPWPWADTWPVARLQAPGRGWSVVVLEGATGRTLAFAPGHLAGSAPPGAPGNSVVAGHRDTHFAVLRELSRGEELRVEMRDGSVRRYRVIEAKVVHESDTRVLAPTAGATLTLITCYPFDTPVPGGPLRYAVVAEERAAPLRDGPGSNDTLPGGARLARHREDGSRGRSAEFGERGGGSPARGEGAAEVLRGRAGRARGELRRAGG